MKYSPHILSAALLAMLTACGGGGGASSAPPTPNVTASSPDYLTLASHCAAPRAGTPDQQGSINDELRWLRSFIDQTYLWYQEVPAGLTPAGYGSTLDYFAVLKTPLITASGRAKDRFHFTYPTAVWNEMNDAGVALGYGITWSTNAGATPRVWAVTMVEPGSPAAAAGVQRGDLLQSVDGVDLNDMSTAGTARLNAGLAPAAAGQTHDFVLRRGGTTLSVSLTSQKITEAPVQNAKVLATPSGAVGYLQFNDHNAVSENALLQAFTTLKNANVNDLVLDMRYNGGGYLIVASELAYMIAGPDATGGKVFDRLQLNDRQPAQAPTMFQAASYGLSPSLLKAGVALPSLGLKRVTVLTTPGTCSASEAVINGLRGVDVEVNLIGGETCGKPYAFVPEDNCGTTYFAIQMQGTNNKGFGDYADGFQPTCAADDDLGHALGDTSERLLATALSYRANGVCPASSSSLRAGAARGTAPLTLVRPQAREISILHR